MIELDMEFIGALIVIILIICFVAGCFFGGGWLVQYNVEHWASWMKGSDVDVNYWKCCIAGVFVGWNIGIPATLVTWVISLSK